MCQSASANVYWHKMQKRTINIFWTRHFENFPLFSDSNPNENRSAQNVLVVLPLVNPDEKVWPLSRTRLISSAIVSRQKKSDPANWACCDGSTTFWQQLGTGPINLLGIPIQRNELRNGFPYLVCIHLPRLEFLISITGSGGIISNSLNVRFALLENVEVLKFDGWNQPKTGENNHTF